MKLSTKRKLRAVRDYLLARAGEPSTWRGLVWLVGGGVMKLSADDATGIENLAALSMLAAGLLGVLLPDRRA